MSNDNTALAHSPDGKKPNLTLIEGRVKTTSRDVADYFGRGHDMVLRSVRNLECSPEFTGCNFAACEYKDETGRMRPMIEMTRDGFIFLVMGFTGKQAAQLKEIYINAFNAMESELLKQNKPSMSLDDRRKLRDQKMRITDRLSRSKDQFIRQTLVDDLKEVYFALGQQFPDIQLLGKGVQPKEG